MPSPYNNKVKGTVALGQGWSTPRLRSGGTPSTRPDPCASVGHRTGAQPRPHWRTTRLKCLLIYGWIPRGEGKVARADVAFGPCTRIWEGASGSPLCTRICEGVLGSRYHWCTLISAHRNCS